MKTTHLLFATVFLPTANCLLPSASIAQTQGPNNGAIFANDAGLGTVAWSSVNNAQTSDNIYATTANIFINCATKATSNYLKVTDFSFSIPPAATITGIKVEILMSRPAPCITPACGGNGPGLSDTIIGLVKGGVVIGMNKAMGIRPACPANNVYQTYGGCTDLWGTTWTPSDINASNFGMVIAFQNQDDAKAIVQIDHVRITVCYTSALSVEPIHFNTPIVVYPTVSSGEFTVDGLHLTVYELKIYNALGKKVYEKSPLLQESKEINITLPSGLGQGVYFLQISALSDPSSGGKTEQRTINQKLIIQK